MVQATCSIYDVIKYILYLDSFAIMVCALLMYAEDDCESENSCPKSTVILASNLVDEKGQNVTLPSLPTGIVNSGFWTKIMNYASLFVNMGAVYSVYFFYKDGFVYELLFFILMELGVVGCIRLCFLHSYRLKYNIPNFIGIILATIIIILITFGWVGKGSFNIPIGEIANTKVNKDGEKYERRKRRRNRRRKRRGNVARQWLLERDHSSFSDSDSDSPSKKQSPSRKQSRSSSSKTPGKEKSSDGSTSKNTKLDDSKQTTSPNEDSKKSKSQTSNSKRSNSPVSNSNKSRSSAGDSKHSRSRKYSKRSRKHSRSRSNSTSKSEVKANEEGIVSKLFSVVNDEEPGSRKKKRHRRSRSRKSESKEKKEEEGFVSKLFSVNHEEESSSSKKKIRTPLSQKISNKIVNSIAQNAIENAFLGGK